MQVDARQISVSKSFSPFVILTIGRIFEVTSVEMLHFVLHAKAEICRAPIGKCETVQSANRRLGPNNTSGRLRY